LGYFDFNSTEIQDLIVIIPKIYEDCRGYFMESYNYNYFKSQGLDRVFVQDNQSKSQRGVLRGLHFQKKYPQGKLIRVISGEVFDVAVDLRQNSPSFRKWFGIILSSENKKQLYIPPGFAHGFLVLSDEAEFFYKCTEYYHPEDEDGILWNDDKIGVEWPLGKINQLIVSEKDTTWKPLENL
jgi:dTDP-4-dehydrorhamnose 3,5-epimerase